MRPLCTILAFPVITVLLVGCASDPRRSTARSESPSVSTHGGSYWAGDGASGPARIKIDIGEQRAYFLKGGQVVGVTPVSTGREGYRTPIGKFAVLDKNIDHISSLYGNFVDADGNVVESDVGSRTHQCPPGAYFSGAPMPYFVRFRGGIGMHAGYLPGYPASHGCVRLPKHMAAHFYHNVQVGTPVDVVN